MQTNLRHYPIICLEGLKKTTKNLSQDSQSPDWDLNLVPPEYKAGVYPLDHDIQWEFCVLIVILGFVYLLYILYIFCHLV
jgi:hypothetical protein